MTFCENCGCISHNEICDKCQPQNIFESNYCFRCGSNNILLRTISQKINDYDKYETIITGYDCENCGYGVMY